MLPIRETFEEAELTGTCGHKYKVLNVYTKKGTNVFPRRRLCEIVSEAGQRTIIKAKSSGVVTQVLVATGDSIADGCEIVEVEACGHTALMGNICCDCGILLREEDLPKSEAVSMLHSVPDLKISRGEAQKLGQEDIRNLLKQQKLVLLVDLDQTLIHTTNDNIPANLKDVYHFQLSAGGPWYHARIRPHTRTFLENISKYFELHISTFGVREYAHHIAHFLDPDHKLFGQRILSRNECLNLMSKKANLDSLFPCGDNLVCIIDDRTDVWNFSPNVVQVAPYHFFRHTGDINAPQGLQKKERDDRDGIDFKNLKKEIIKPVVSTGDEKKEVGSSDLDAAETQPSSQSPPTFQQGASEVTADGERGPLSDTKSNEDSGNYSGSDDSWESSPEVVESSPEGQESSLGVQESSAEKNTRPENQDSNPETQESNPKKETDSEDKKNLPSLEPMDSSIGTKETTPEKKEICSDGNVLSTDKETDSSLELNPESQQLGSEIQEQKSTEVHEIQEQKSTEVHEEAKDTDCSKESESEVTKTSGNKEVDQVQHDQESPSKESKDQLTQQESQTISQQQVFDVVDNDDYLLYLEDILKKIHSVFFKDYEASLMEQDDDKKQKEPISAQKGATLDQRPLPDLKKIVPGVKKDVLHGVSLVFSGVVPQQVKLKESKAYLIATAFGATVSDRLIVRGEAGIPTTHLVAANRHTEKVNAARKMKSIKIVTPNWLWKCTERWEWVEERLFPLTKETEKEVQRVPPLHCSNPDAAWLASHDLSDPVAPQRMRTPSGSLLQDINPLVYLSSDDKNNMEDEVEKILSDDNDSEGESESEASEDNSDSNDMEEGGDEDEEEEEDYEDEDGEPKKKKRKSNELGDEEDENEDELPSVTFRQGGQLPSDDSNSEEDDDDEGDLRRMGADLENLLN
ncbi:RNA polymerase II subunit A C-terminal domain phosphatase-like isoform X2 [Portunus trituberculatus]|uniref:RNA polymerase II subunit A C-terminal domain phosphatase-like isoform X2 n=1 Tax=Portunus trituberculatus TaxID=210409 RepID=UPI001E1CF404|nr:RNA polymerase II subunit A C-terminal domain phosphatase-like isoform X2 [Portunus trituberculatus]